VPTRTDAVIAPLRAEAANGDRRRRARHPALEEAGAPVGNLLERPVREEASAWLMNVVWPLRAGRGPGRRGAASSNS